MWECQIMILFRSSSAPLKRPVVSFLRYKNKYIKVLMKIQLQKNVLYFIKSKIEYLTVTDTFFLSKIVFKSATS